MLSKTQWKNRIVEIGTEDPEQLLANPMNFRIHPKHQQDALEAVLDEIGWVDDVIVNRTTGHIIDGHLRVTLALRKNESEIPVKYVELSQDEENLILALFDPISAMATQDDEKLEELIYEIENDNYEIKKILDCLQDKKNNDDVFDMSDKIENEYEVVIECVSEMEQEKIYTELNEKGYKCRLLTL